MQPSDRIPPDMKQVLAWIAIIALGSFAMWHLEAGGPVGPAALAAVFITGGALIVYGLWGIWK
jgi:hypothetical protein